MADPLPLQQLAMFDAAAQHLSFTKAARDMNVQQPAVSRQIAALETYLGQKLFLRTKPKLTLTDAGRALHSAVSDGFGGMRSTMRALRTERRSAAVVVDAAIGFTSLYLMPRLAAFQALRPDVAVQIVTRDQNAGFDLDRADIVVSFGSEGLPGCASRPILREELLPICAPGVLQGDIALPIRALPKENLLHMSSPDHADDWKLYLAETGLEAPVPQVTDRIMSYMVYLLAIQSGQGIGLGWLGLVDKALEDQSLLPACNRTVTTHRAYYANLTPRATGMEDPREFWHWLTTL